MIPIGYQYLILERHSYALLGSVKGEELNMCASKYSVDREEIGIAIDTTSIECSLSALAEIRLVIMSGSLLEPLWNTLVRKYHYLGHQRIFGKRLKYIAFLDRRPIAALGFEDEKKYRGMDHYEHRSWPGWLRHMTYVVLSLLFLQSVNKTSK